MSVLMSSEVTVGFYIYAFGIGVDLMSQSIKVHVLSLHQILENYLNKRRFLMSNRMQNNTNVLI